MSYDEEQQRRSRLVVETPTARREVVQTQTTRTPERAGFSTGMVAAVALTAIAATAIIFLFLMNRGDGDANANVRIATTQPTPATQPTVIIQQPATQPTPIIIQQAPPTTTQPAPVIITQPAPLPPTATAPGAAPSDASSTTTSGTDDATLQTNLDKQLSNDPDLSVTDVTATVVNGRATLEGTVSTPTLKRQAERLAYRVKGVRTVDNKINVVGPALP